MRSAQDEHAEEPGANLQPEVEAGPNGSLVLSWRRGGTLVRVEARQDGGVELAYSVGWRWVDAFDLREVPRLGVVARLLGIAEAVG